MQHELLIAKLVEEGTVGDILKQGCSDEDLVRELQTILFELGYGRPLKWKKLGASGKYDAHTAKAVKALADNNNLWNNGDKVDQQLAVLLLELYDLLDEMQLLYSDLKTGKVEDKYFRGSPWKASIAALQTLLDRAGYDKELQWERLGNDGTYGDETTAAVLAYATHEGRRKQSNEGVVFEKKLAKNLLKSLATGYGKDWPRTRKTVNLGVPTTEEIKEEAFTEDIKPVPPKKEIPPSNPLVTYENTHFTGKTILCDVEFIPALERVHAYAVKHDIKLLITSSFRTTTNVVGAVVTPAKMSNHLAGHAIDFNIKYGPGHRTIMRFADLKRRSYPPQVQRFFDDVRRDDMLRWGGDFAYFDPIHIDDHLNKDLGKWRARYEAVQHARAIGLA